MTFEITSTKSGGTACYQYTQRSKVVAFMREVNGLEHGGKAWFQFDGDDLWVFIGDVDEEHQDDLSGLTSDDPEFHELVNGGLNVTKIDPVARKYGLEPKDT